VIVLNGGSSSGETSIGWCLQAVLPGSWLLLGVDNLIEALPTEHKGGTSPIVLSPPVASRLDQSFGDLRLPGTEELPRWLGPAWR
jgi:chloramphenicol 3-O phosphotransferase